MDHNLLQVYLKDVNLALSANIDSNVMDMLNELSSLEVKFFKRIKYVNGGRQTYRDFIHMISRDKENLIVARKFFREREDAFKGKIYKAIMKKNVNDLLQYKANFLMCVFVMEKLTIKDKRLALLFDKITKLRSNIIQSYLHFAINRAKSFNTGANYNVDFNDLVQIANEALISAVDKFVIDENSSTFRAMVIGRMTAGLIASGDQALCVTFGPQASRRLYQVKRLLEKQSDLSISEISAALDVSEEEISAIINASSVSSLDADLGDGNDGDAPSITLKDFIPAPPDSYSDPYEQVEHADIIRKIYEQFQNLTVLEQKILRLKGVNFDQYL